MKDKCIAIIQKQIIMKIKIWWRESYKTLTRIWKNSRGMVLASPSGVALDFKAWPWKDGEGGGLEMEILLNWVRKKLRVLAGIVFQGSNAMLFSMANLANANYWMAWRIYVSILFRFHYEDQDIVLWKYFTPFSSVSIFTFGMCLLGSSV